jgi:hypothetical protein
LCFSLTGLDDFFNIHNTIHILMPSNNQTSDTLGTTATLVNPRILGGLWPGAAAGLNASDENNRTLDQWYGSTSPMTNAVTGVDSLTCRTFNTFQQKFGGPQVSASEQGASRHRASHLTAA